MYAPRSFLPFTARDGTQQVVASASEPLSTNSLRKEFEVKSVEIEVKQGLSEVTSTSYEVITGHLECLYLG